MWLEYTCAGVGWSNTCGDGLIAYPIKVCDNGAIENGKVEKDDQLLVL